MQPTVSPVPVSSLGLRLIPDPLFWLFDSSDYKAVILLVQFLRGYPTINKMKAVQPLKLYQLSATLLFADLLT